MLTKLQERITTIDLFPFNPEQALVFNKQKKFQTFPGGVWTMLLIILMGVLWFQQFYQMLYYLNNSVLTNTTAVKFDELGTVDLKSMETFPMFNIRYKGNYLPRISFDFCAEFNGDCFKFA